MEEFFAALAVWAALIALIALLAWISDRPVKTFVGFAILCWPVALIMLIASRRYRWSDGRLTR